MLTLIQGNCLDKGNRIHPIPGKAEQKHHEGTSRVSQATAGIRATAQCICSPAILDAEPQQDALRPQRILLSSEKE